MTVKTLTRWYGQVMNRRMSERLRTSSKSRLHKNHMLLSYSGRKTGKAYTIPVNYCVTDNGGYAIGTEAGWQQNFVDGLDVKLEINGEQIEGRGTILPENDSARERYGRQLSGFMWGLFSKSLTIIEIQREN
ncbi:MAG: DUF385 domain-containing protein [Pseudomonadales bacterium]|nr:DUF385 domain-containing protein [Pseudomonadales bacterium]